MILRRARYAGLRELAMGSLVLLAISIAPATAAVAEPHEGLVLARNVMAHLELDAGAFEPRLLNGEVIHRGMLGERAFPEEVSAVGAMVVVRGFGADRIVDAFLDSETFRRVHQVRRFETFASSGERSEVYRELQVGDAKAAKQLLTEPTRHFNVSKAEAERVRTIARGSGDTRELATQAMIDILAGRLEAFERSGLEGLEPYRRKGDKPVSAGAELDGAIGQLTFLEPVHPGWAQGLRAPGKSPLPSGLDRKLYWLDIPFQGFDVLALTNELRGHGDRKALAVDLHFYASRGYFAMLTLVGVVPFGEDSLVFSINHTFTDQVLGFGSSVKRNVARKAISAQLVSHLETARELLLSAGHPGGS